MTDIRNAARIAMASKLLADAAREEGAAARQVLEEQMRRDGAERIRVTGDNATDYGTVVLAAGRRTARVVNESAFAKWAADRYPDEVVPTVRPAFRDRLLAHAARTGDPVDEQGEVMPGVEIAQGDPYLNVRPTGEARDRMRTALAAQGLLILGASEDVSGVEGATT